METALDEVEMAVRQGIERARVHGANGHKSLLLWGAWGAGGRHATGESRPRNGNEMAHSGPRAVGSVLFGSQESQGGVPELTRTPVRREARHARQRGARGVLHDHLGPGAADPRRPERFQRAS